MQNNIAGPGMGLPVPQNLYPSNLLNGAPYPEGQTEITLAAGQAIPVPAGKWIVGLGSVALLQYYDPVTTTWRGFSSARMQHQIVDSDGFNIRVANLTGCPVAAVVTTAGTTYKTATTTITPSAGNSTWVPVIGGALASISVLTAGSGYGVAPIVYIPAPPAPGIQATATAAISGGTVTSITLVNVGGGYTAVPTITVLPNPTDPNFATITAATASTAISASAGKLTGVLCTNSGVPVASSTTLTITGGDATAAASIVWMSTITAASVTVSGSGYTAESYATTIGGVTAATPTFTNPSTNQSGYIPRPAMIGLAGNGTTLTSVSTIYDGGLFTGTPQVLVLTGGIITTVATVTLTQGGASTTVSLQQM